MFRYFYLLCLLLLCVLSHAQLNYKFTALQGTYVPVAAPDTALLIFESLAGETISDDGISSPIPIGFTFNYNGSNYSTMSASTNGFASFKNLVPIIDFRNNYYSVPDLMWGPYGEVDVRPILAPLWDDHDLYSQRGIVYKTTGTAPDRVFTLQWDDVYWDKTSEKFTVTFQIKLFETSNVVEFHYKQLPGAMPKTASASIGITGINYGPNTYISLENTSGSPTISTVKDVYTLNTKPATGQIYRFSPIYTTAADGNWDNPATWVGNAVPPKGVAVIIKHDLIGNINTTCNSIQVEGKGKGSLKVNPGIKIDIVK